MKTKILISVAVLLALNSCKKDTIAPVAGEELLSRVTITEPALNRIGTGHYMYDSQGRLTSIIGTNNGIGNRDTTRSLFTYDTAGHLSSLLVTNNTTGNQYRYDYLTGADGRIISSTGTALQPNMFAADYRFTYDVHGRMISDSAFTKTGALYSYSVLQYNSDGNVSSFQDFIITGSTVYTQGIFTYQVLIPNELLLIK